MLKRASKNEMLTFSSVGVDWSGSVQGRRNRRGYRELMAFSISVQEYSVSCLASLSAQNGGSMGYRLFRRRQISLSFVIGCVGLGLRYCGIVGFGDWEIVCVGLFVSLWVLVLCACFFLCLSAYPFEGLSVFACLCLFVFVCSDFCVVL